MTTSHLYGQPRPFDNQYLWGQALVRFGSHLTKRPRLNSAMPKLESMFVPPMPQTILPRAIAPMLNPFATHFPGSKASMFTEAMRTRKNAVCRNFGSVRCSKCNKFGLSGECCNAYYYVVIRSKKVPREVQKQIAQTAFESFKEAETFRVEIARKYKKIRRKRKRQPQIEETIKCQQNSESSLQTEESNQCESRTPVPSQDLPKCALSEQDQRIKIAAESLLGLDRLVVPPSPPNNPSSEEKVRSDFPLTPPRPFEDTAVEKTAHYSSSPLTVIPNGLPSTTHRTMDNLTKNTKVRCVDARSTLQPPAKTCLKGNLLHTKQILLPQPYMHYPCSNYTRMIPEYQVRARHYM